MASGDDPKAIIAYFSGMQSIFCLSGKNGSGDNFFGLMPDFGSDF